MTNLTLEELLSPYNINLDDYDYYVYNNHKFTPVQVDIDDIIEPTECLLHIRDKGSHSHLNVHVNSLISLPQRIFKIADLYLRFNSYDF